MKQSPWENHEQDTTPDATHKRKTVDTIKFQENRKEKQKKKMRDHVFTTFYESLTDLFPKLLTTKLNSKNKTNSSSKAFAKIF